MADNCTTVNTPSLEIIEDECKGKRTSTECIYSKKPLPLLTLGGNSSLEDIIDRLIEAKVRNFKGLYNASNNTPLIVNGVGVIGDTYIVVVEGTQNFGSGNITFLVGDEVVYTPSLVWKRIPKESSTITFTNDTFNI